MSTQGRLEQLNSVIERIMSDWYGRLRQHYVTDEDSRELGLEPEVKYFHEFGSHRIKFSRMSELDVTYGLAAEQKNGSLVVVSSVNNKSNGFDYDRFVEKLKLFYWASRNEKPWTEPEFDHFAYGDLVEFEPRMGHSVSLDIRKDKADILRLAFQIVPEHEALLLANPAMLQDLVESYCLHPLKRIYAESYRQC